MQSCLLFLNLGGSEVVMILLVILLLFGGKGIPTIAKTLGKSVREFKDAAAGIQRDLQDSAHNTNNEVHEKIQEVKREFEQDLSVKRDDDLK